MHKQCIESLTGEKIAFFFGLHKNPPVLFAFVFFQECEIFLLFTWGRSLTFFSVLDSLLICFQSALFNYGSGFAIAFAVRVLSTCFWTEDNIDCEESIAVVKNRALRESLNRWRASRSWGRGFDLKWQQLWPKKIYDRPCYISINVIFSSVRNELKLASVEITISSPCSYLSALNQLNIDHAPLICS